MILISSLNVYSYDISEEEYEKEENAHLKEKKSGFYFEKMIKTVRNDLPIKKPILNTKKGNFN